MVLQAMLRPYSEASLMTRPVNSWFRTLHNTCPTPSCIISTHREGIKPQIFYLNSKSINWTHCNNKGYKMRCIGSRQAYIIHRHSHRICQYVGLVRRGIGNKVAPLLKCLLRKILWSSQGTMQLEIPHRNNRRREQEQTQARRAWPYNFSNCKTIESR